MATLIDRIQKSLDKEGLAPRTRQSRAWLQSKISSLNASQRSLFRDVDRTTRSAFVGHMYFFTMIQSIKKNCRIMIDFLWYYQ